MNKARKRNKGLPRRVYARGRTWYFFAREPMRDPRDGKVKQWIPLAKFDQGESAMLQALATLLSDRRSLEGSIPFVCAEYKADRLDKSNYSADTKAQYRAYLEKFADDFEDFHVAQIKTKDIADFLRDHYGDKPNTAQKISGLLKRVFKYAISTRGLRDDNPLDQLEMGDYETERREVLPTHAQVERIRQHGMYFVKQGQRIETQSGPMFGCIVDMAYLLWQRAIDIRTIKEAQIANGVISFKPSKTVKSSGKAVDIVITPAIQEVIDRARAIKRERDIVSVYLFPSRNGTAYGKSGLKTMWDRAKVRAGMADVDVTFRDLRALAATDAAKRGEQKDAIRMRLAHTTTKTSEIYIKEVVPEVSAMDLSIPWKTI